MYKTIIHPNGQWELKKSAAMNLKPKQALVAPSIHTVEVHPDIDHLYRAKGMIADSGKPHLQLNEFKRAGISRDIIKKLPRDAKGKVTAEMIDKHIEGLPKHKVNVEVHPYDWGAQQHRPGDQYALTVQMHPESKMKMDPDNKKIWDNIKGSQHSMGSKYEGRNAVNDVNHAKDNDQIGWSRIDADSKPGHWHIDEIQSDFHNKKKIDSNINPPLSHTIESITSELDDIYYKKTGKSHPDTYPDPETGEVLPRGELLKEVKKTLEQRKEERKHFERAMSNDNKKKLLSHLSHGHDDPQHLIHSATNALARKLGIDSMSMDTPRDQAKQSGLVGSRTYNDIDDGIYEEMGNHHPQHWEDELSSLKDKSHPSLNNPNFKTALDKIGGVDTLTKLADASAGSGSSVDIPYNISFLMENLQNRENPKLKENLKEYENLSNPEKHALQEMLLNHYNTVHTSTRQNLLDNIGDEEDSVDNSKLEVPVHQMNTYNKRPKKLGMELRDKNEVLGEQEFDDENDRVDEAKQVQYMKLHKSLLKLKKALKNARR